MDGENKFVELNRTKVIVAACSCANSMHSLYFFWLSATPPLPELVYLKKDVFPMVV
jgi:hypothetical protein